MATTAASLEEMISATVEAAVERAVEPLRAEIVRLRQAQEERTLTYAEAAKLLHVSTRTLERMVSDGEIMPVRVGSRVRFPLSALLPRDSGGRPT